MHVGCLEAESRSFWDGGQRPELRDGQYCTGDTRLGVEPSNPSLFQGKVRGSVRQSRVGFSIGAHDVHAQNHAERRKCPESPAVLCSFP
eukprot:6984244-Prymnesium_polylepis.1